MGVLKKQFRPKMTISTTFLAFPLAYFTSVGKFFSLQFDSVIEADFIKFFIVEYISLKNFSLRNRLEQEKQAILGKNCPLLGRRIKLQKNVEVANGT